jgi:hypothetical protein
MFLSPSHLFSSVLCPFLLWINSIKDTNQWVSIFHSFLFPDTYTLAMIVLLPVLILPHRVFLFCFPIIHAVVITHMTPKLPFTCSYFKNAEIYYCLVINCKWDIVVGYRSNWLLTHHTINTVSLPYSWAIQAEGFKLAYSHKICFHTSPYIMPWRGLAGIFIVSTLPCVCLSTFYRCHIEVQPSGPMNDPLRICHDVYIGIYCMYW